MAYNKLWAGEKDWNEFARCPYCGRKEDDSNELQEDSSVENGGTEETVCGGCGETYRLSLSLTYFWRTAPLEEIEDED